MQFLIVTFIVHILWSYNMICWAASTQGMFCYRILCMQHCCCHVCCTNYLDSFIIRFLWQIPDSRHFQHTFCHAIWTNHGHLSVFQALSFSSINLLIKETLQASCICQKFIFSKDVTIATLEQYTCILTTVHGTYFSSVSEWCGMRNENVECCERLSILLVYVVLISTKRKTRGRTDISERLTVTRHAACTSFK